MGEKDEQIEMTTFLQGLQRVTNTARTENGAVTNASALDPVVDFFGLAGAMRSRPVDAADLFEKAYARDPQTAVRTLFYLRDVRGGQGERDVFRACFRRLINVAPQDAVKVLEHIPFYGRWDDLLSAHRGATGEQITEIICNQWDADVAAYERGEGVSLLAKWLPSDKTGSTNRDRTRFAMAVRNMLGLDQRDYRHTLSALRERIGLLEQDMSGNRWGDIDYGKLPAQAHRKHVKAFRRHSDNRYQAYLDSVERGEAKVNTSTLYPYELYEMVRNGDAKAAEVLWNNLPDYTREGQDAIVLADVSGSMYGRPMAVSVSLALYFAERNTGPYRGYFMTFASTPKLVQVAGGSLKEKLRSVENSTGWCGSTNLEAAFQAILHAGIYAGSVPSTLYVVSDMEFDAALNRADLSVFDGAKLSFQREGFQLPHVVFWNVNARNNQAPATIMDNNVTLVSGLSPTTFAMAVEGKSPRELVDSVVNGPRYQRIVL